MRPECWRRTREVDRGAIDGRRIVKRSTPPFCDAARVLLGEGINPDTAFVMRHDGSPYDALRSTVGVAAKLTVKDNHGKPASGAGSHTVGVSRCRSRRLCAKRTWPLFRSGARPVTP
jgi:hypothetical protein